MDQPVNQNIGTPMGKISRYEFITMAGEAAALALAPTGVLSLTTQSLKKMYGLIGKIIAKDGRRDELIEILLEGSTEMPGCLSYIVAKDAQNENAIWVTEAWESKESHKKSLSLPSVKEAIGKGRPLIADFGEQIETEPAGGHGLASADL